MTPPPLSADGSLPFDETGERIGPATTVDAFEQSNLRKLGSLHLGTDHSTCKLAERRILGPSFNVTLTFVGSRLHSIDLFPNRPADAKGWDAWTLENEMARKQWAEDWAARTFGKELVIKPFIIPGVPDPITPATPKPEHTRHALFDWGEVCSYFDSKGGFAGVRITYTVPPVPPPADP